jgi:hypothetical protein
VLDGVCADPELARIATIAIAAAPKPKSGQVSNGQLKLG